MEKKESGKTTAALKLIVEKLAVVFAAIAFIGLLAILAGLAVGAAANVWAWAFEQF